MANLHHHQRSHRAGAEVPGGGNPGPSSWPQDQEPTWFDVIFSAGRRVIGEYGSKGRQVLVAGRMAQRPTRRTATPEKPEAAASIDFLTSKEAREWRKEELDGDGAGRVAGCGSERSGRRRWSVARPR
jgi:single-stranded DNA-binding protein